MRRRWPVRLCVVLCLAGFGGAASSPALAAPDIDVTIEDVPDRFRAGALPANIQAVVSQRDGGRCRKVTWSLVMRLDGVRRDDVQVDRVEEDGSFPFKVREEGGAVRFTDLAPDPGTLCDGRTVTARYRIDFDRGIPDGSVALQVEAYDANFRLLGSDTASREVDGDKRPEPTGEPTPEPTQTAPPAGGAGGQAGGQRPVDAARPLPMPPLGFIVGAVLLLVGAGLLLQVRRGLRRSRPGFAPAAGPRRRPMPPR